MADINSPAIQASGPEAYQAETITVAFYIPLPKATYIPPKNFAVRQADNKLNVEATQIKLKEFVSNFEIHITPTNVLHVGTTYFKTLGITPANWKDFGAQFPTLIVPVKEAAFRIATLLLNTTNNELVAARFLSRIATYRGYGINQEGHLISAARLPECSLMLQHTNASKGEALYDKLILSLKYSLTAADAEFEDSTGHGGCFSVEKNSTLIKANAGPDQTVDEKTEQTLDGKDSYSSSGVIQSFHWEQIAGPTVTWNASQDSKEVRFITPQVFQDKVLQFKLTITDRNSHTYTDDVSYKVLNSANEMPTVVIKGRNEIMAGERVTLIATASDPNPDDTLGFTWEEVTRSGIRIRHNETEDPKKSQVSFTTLRGKDVPYFIKVRVIVKDGHDHAHQGEMSQEWVIKILPNPNPEPVAMVAPPAPASAPRTQQPKPVATTPNPTHIAVTATSPANPKGPAASKTKTSLPDPLIEIPTATKAITPAEFVAKTYANKPLPPLPAVEIEDPDDVLATQLVTNNDPDVRNYRLAILFDVSQSMLLSAKSFERKLNTIIDNLLKKTAVDGFIEVAIGCYVDQNTYITMPFQRAYHAKDDEIAQLKESLLRGTKDVLAHFTENQGIESLWHTIYEIIAGDRHLTWEPKSAETAQMIYAITDMELFFPDNIVDQWSPETTQLLAKHNGISLNFIQMENSIFAANKFPPIQAMAILADNNASVEAKRSAAQEITSSDFSNIAPHVLAAYDQQGNNHEEIRLHLLETLNQFWIKESEDLLRIIVADDQTSVAVRSRALAILNAHLDSSTVFALNLKILENSEKKFIVDLRLAAARYLDEVHNRGLLPSLMVTITDPEATQTNLTREATDESNHLYLRMICLDLLRSLPFNAKVAGLALNLLQNNDGKNNMRLRLAAVGYLEKYSYTQGQSIYLAILNDKNAGDHLRKKMAALLKTIDNAEAVAGLMQATNDPSNSLEIRNFCADSLLAAGKTSSIAKTYLAILGPNSFVVARGIQKHEEPYLKDVIAPDVLLSAYKQSLARPNQDIYWSLGTIDHIRDIGTPDSVSYLIETMKDPDIVTNVRTQSAAALGRFNQPQVVTELVVVFGKATDPYLRRSAGESLAQLKSPEALPIAIKIIKEEKNDDVVSAAILVVASSGDPRAADLIKKALWRNRHSELIQATATAALSQI